MARKDKPAAAAPPKPAGPQISLTGEDMDEYGRPQLDESTPRAPGYNAADPAKVEAARKEAGQQRRQDRDYWRICMSTPDRRASLYRLLERCHIFGEPTDLGSGPRHSDTHSTYYNLGQQSVGKQMMSGAQEASLDLYLTMLKEQKEMKDARERKDEQQ